MTQSLQLGGHSPSGNEGEMRRVNRLPVVVALVLVLLFAGVVIAGLSWRGLSFESGGDAGEASSAPATSFGDQLKRGIGDGIIGDPEERQVFQPTPPVIPKVGEATPPAIRQEVRDLPRQRPPLEGGEEWKDRLKREQDEQYLRERNRQRMARLQAQAAALDSPLQIDVSDVRGSSTSTARAGSNPTSTANTTSDNYVSALRASLSGQAADQNGQTGKEEFFNQDIKDLGYLPSQVVPQISRYELKRGSVIPATLITGINSDLPGRITAQVSQNVYDSASGYSLLVPQGAKLFGRYDSKLSFGQERVLVVWTDLIFPNGSTLQIEGMSGTDAEGYGGFSDKVDRHLWRTFGAAALIAVIGTGIDLSLPESSTLSSQTTASDAARRNFAESFGRAAEQTISKNLNVQPTVRIRPGFTFNVLVDQDIVFPGRYNER